MTRINVIPVKELHQKHLVAEYRELPRIISLAEQSLGKEIVRPSDYVLGKGHMHFFTDKLLFIQNRYCELYQEMLDRGYNPSYNPNTIRERIEVLPADSRKNYTPSAQAIALNRQRIEQRLKEM